MNVPKPLNFVLEMGELHGVQIIFQYSCYFFKRYFKKRPMIYVSFSETRHLQIHTPRLTNRFYS